MYVDFVKPFFSPDFGECAGVKPFFPPSRTPINVDPRGAKKKERERELIASDCSMLRRSFLCFRKFASSSWKDVAWRQSGG